MSAGTGLGICVALAVLAVAAERDHWAALCIAGAAVFYFGM